MMASRKLFEALAGGPLPGWDGCAAAVTAVKRPAGTSLFRAGDAVRDIYVVREGLVKLSYVRADGGEWIKSFHPEGAFFSSIAALATGEASAFDATALEFSVIEKVPFAEIARRADADLAWSRALRTALVRLAVRKEEREREFLTLDAEERYLRFARTNPTLLRRITQKDLAVHLGVTPVGLNRIVRRVAAPK